MFARLTTLALGMICLVFIAGCGQVTASGGNGSAGNANATTTMTSQGSAMTTAGTTVVITTDHSVYAPDGAVQVRVINHLSESIFAQDTQASCSILGLQVQQGADWQASRASRCSQGRLAKSVEIAPGATFTAAITAGDGMTAGTFPTGTYRLVLSYSMRATTPVANEVRGFVGPMTTMYSAEWLVR